jgi:hypothetical protein
VPQEPTTYFHHHTMNESLLFSQARDEFLAGLSDRERATFSKCGSTEELLRSCENFDVISKAKRRGLPWIRRIKTFSDHLEPYFKVLEILCASHPEWANVALGALRLVLALATNFTTFFERLTKTIERITKVLPQFDDVLSFVKDQKSNVSKRLKDSMLNFYVDLFSFFRAVCRVFSTHEGKVRRTPTVIGDLFWKPFDVRFGEILDQMRFHQQVAKDALQWAYLSDLKNAADIADKRDKAEIQDRQRMLAKTIHMTDQLEKDRQGQ